jgi:hypothetical protein
MDTSLTMTQEDLPLSSSPLLNEVEGAKKQAIRSLWLAFFTGWIFFSPMIIAMIAHLSKVLGTEYGIAIGISGLLSFLLMWTIQWNFIRGIKRNKKNSILKLAIFVIVFMVLSSGSDSSEDFAPILGQAHWLIYISGFGLLFTSLWQLYTLWVLRKKLAPYALNPDTPQA